MHEIVGKDSAKTKAKIKELITKLHEGVDPQTVRAEFREFIKGLTPFEIASAEEQLIKEGMPVEEIHHMCDVHLEVMQESLVEDQNLAPEGHPINILMQEHSELLKFANKLRDTYKEMKDKKNFISAQNELATIFDIIDHLKAAESHYLREENILFSYLEKYGVTQPPKIMWMEHDRIREIEKNLFKLIDDKDGFVFSEFLEKFHTYAHGLAEMLANHFAKENKVLFPTAIQLFKEEEWVEIRRQFDDVGYCCFTPEIPDQTVEVLKETPEQETIDSKLIDLGTGKVELEQLKMIFKTLPFDLTFVGKDDTVEFYSEGHNRIFVRTPSVIGRLVTDCHPNKSIDKVLEIIEGFKNKTLDKAEFWLNVNDKLIYIRYFPVRNLKGEYLGVLEVTQNITDIKKIEGEKRLL